MEPVKPKFKREPKPTRKWARAKKNHEFISIQTYSGYGGGMNADPKGVELILPADASDEALGSALLDALSRSRFVLGAPRTDVWLHPKVEFDADLTDPERTQERYKAWVSNLMARFGYKTKRAMFKDMMSCGIELDDGVISIRPSHHYRLDGWDGEGLTEADHVHVSERATPADIGAALKLAFSRCTG